MGFPEVYVGGGEVDVEAGGGGRGEGGALEGSHHLSCFIFYERSFRENSSYLLSSLLSLLLLLSSYSVCCITLLSMSTSSALVLERRDVVVGEGGVGLKERCGVPEGVGCY